jgi:hypothetical protein
MGSILRHKRWEGEGRERGKQFSRENTREREKGMISPIHLADFKFAVEA